MTFDQAVALLPGGRFEGGGYRAACPAHGGRDRNLSVWADENGIACFKCWSHGCSTRDIVIALAAAPTPAKGSAFPAKPKITDQAKNIEYAQRIWREAREPRGTLVQNYLFGRGWTGEMSPAMSSGADSAELAPGGVGLAIPPSIRFHPRLWYAPRVYLPAMVTAIENLDGRIVAIHRTYLKPDGTGKAEVEHNKKALGPIRGCTVHLTAGAPELLICEGIETGLSILQETRLHVWAALGTSNLGQVELPTFVCKIVIAADHDDPGITAARAACVSYGTRGFTCSIARPRSSGWDFNDLVTRRGGDGG